MKVSSGAKEKKISNKLIFLFMVIYLIRKFRKLMGFLTQYFPFSLLPDRLYIHSKNREQNTASDLLRDEAFKLGMSFETSEETDNQHFIYISGTFMYRKKDRIKKLIAKIQEILGETNFYVKKVDEKKFTFMFAKGYVNKAESLGKIKPLI